MVRGLEIFRRYFASYQDHYVLIGGTATTLVMDAHFADCERLATKRRKWWRCIRTTEEPNGSRFNNEF